MIKTALKHRLRAYRNPVYIVYAAAGIALFWFGWLVARAGLGNLETYIFRFFNELPDAIKPIFVVISLAGTIGFVMVATAISLLRRHYSHAAKFLIAGAGSWLMVKWIKTFEIRLRPPEILDNVNLREPLDSIVGYPSGHAAVAASLGVIAYQYLPKRYHKLITWTIVLVCLSRLYLGMHLPIDLVGGFGIGLAIASILNFVFGDTEGKFVPTNIVKSKLHVLHLDIKSVERANVDARGSTPFIVTQNDDTKVFVKIIDTTNNVADWLFKITRKVLYRRLKDESPFLTPKQQLEHEAYVAGLAHANNVRTPVILGIFHVREDMWGMAQVMIPGKSLDKIDPALIDKTLLTKIWQQVQVLHNANIIHRDLRAANIFLDKSNEPWLIDFGFSEASVSSNDFHRDTVELISSLSCIVDPNTVLKTAVAVIGKDEIIEALPYIDYASLSGATTSILKTQKGKLELIRSLIQNLSGEPKTKTKKLKRFDKKTALYVIIFGLFVFGIVPKLSTFNSSLDELSKSRLEYLLAALFCSVISYPAAASVYRFISPFPLKFYRTMLINISTSFTNRLLPASTGAITTNIRYLTKSGYSNTQASSIVALNNLVGLLGHMSLLFIVASLSQSTLDDIIVVDVPPIVALIITGSLLFAGIVVATNQKLQRRLRTTLHSVRRDAKLLFAQPSRFSFALLSAMLITTSYVLALYFSAGAIGHNISILQAFLVFTVGAATASVTPTPGGIGGAEAGLIAGLVSVGVDADSALAITLVYRLVTFWLPILPGIIAFHIANKRHYL